MKACILLICCLLTAVTPAMGDDLSPSDFAYGLPLTVANDHALHALTVPLAVYEKSNRKDLGDVRVFNGAGSVVPHALRQVSRQEEEVRHSIPFFPLAGAPQPLPADLSVRVTRNTDGSVVSVDSRVQGNAAQPAGSYLLDTTALAVRPKALELQWSQPTGLLTVALLHSRDLVHWSPLISKTVLADLAYNGGTVTTRRLTLPVSPLPYLRLDCIECREPMQIQEITALSGTPISADQWQWLKLEGRGLQKDKDTWWVEYHLQAKIPVTALQLALPEANTLLRAVIETKPLADGPWRQVLPATDFYRLNLDGRQLNNQVVSCGPITDTQWRIRVLADGANLGKGTSLPQLEVGWHPQQLLFLSRGDGPYTLAFGSTNAEPNEPGQNNLVLSAVRDAKAEALMQHRQPGPMMTLGGDKALEPMALKFSWKKILLWTVLVAGVLLLALITRSILREMRNQTP